MAHDGFELVLLPRIRNPAAARCRPHIPACISSPRLAAWGRDVGKVLRQQARQKDPVGRPGGEEFGVLFTRLTPEAARAASQRFIEQVAAHESQLASGANVRVTMSGGLTMVEPGEAIEAAYRRADQLLYQAKRSGKARIEYEFRQPPVGTLVDLRTGPERERGFHRAPSASCVIVARSGCGPELGHKEQAPICSPSLLRLDSTLSFRVDQ